MIPAPYPEPGTLYYDDCLSRLRLWPAQCVDMIYLDPPFNSKAQYNILFGRGRTTPTAQAFAFTDMWSWDERAAHRWAELQGAAKYPTHKIIKGLHTFLGECGMLAYLIYMGDRLVELHRVLKNGGTLYLHCDPSASHYLKLVLDSIFAKDGFRNEIIWCYAGGGGTEQGLSSKARHHLSLC